MQRAFFKVQSSIRCRVPSRGLPLHPEGHLLCMQGLPCYAGSEVCAFMTVGTHADPRLDEQPLAQHTDLFCLGGLLLLVPVGPDMM